jgi:hypothetical protein
MHSRLLPVLVVALITSGGLLMLNNERQNKAESSLMTETFGNW